MAPDRHQLQNMSQREKESFKEYAQRWRELVAQVEPPLAEKELTGLFMDTLQSLFWEKMIGSVSSGFADLVTIGERLEEGIKKGKITGVEASNSAKKPYGNFQKKKEGEAHAVSVEKKPRHRQQQYVQPYVAAVAPVVNAQPVQAPPQQNAGQNQNRNARARTQFDPIPMTYTELYPGLVQRGFITTRPLTPPNPLPSGFRSDLHCEFHKGVAGHDLEHCFALKARVRELIRDKILSFHDENPNVVNNPLPGHAK